MGCRERLTLASITNALLYPYAGSARIYQCPGDIIAVAGSAVPRFALTRSVA